MRNLTKITPVEQSHEQLVWAVFKDVKDGHVPSKDERFTRKAWVQEGTTRESLPSRPFIIILRLLGCMPMSLTEDGEPHFKIFSPIMAYSIFVFVAILIAITYEIKTKFPQIYDMKNGGSKNMDTIVNATQFIVFYVKYAMVPIMMWLPVKRLVKHQMKWMQLERNFARTTGHQLEFEFHNVTRNVAICIPIISCVLPSLWVLRSSPGQPWMVLVYMVPIATSLAFDGFWCTSFIIIGKAAEQVNQRLKEHFTRYEGSPETQEVLLRNYRSLWTDLSRQLQGSNDVSTVTFSYHTIHLFLMLTLSLYSLLSSIRGEWGQSQIIFLLSTILYVTELWFIANSAHFTAAKFEDIQWDAFWLIPPPGTVENVKKEIRTLLDVAAASPRIVDIGGFVTINRSWLTNILGNLLSSLIILLQFKVSNNSESVITESPGERNVTTLSEIV